MSSMNFCYKRRGGRYNIDDHFFITKKREYSSQLLDIVSIIEPNKSFKYKSSSNPSNQYSLEKFLWLV